MYVPFNFLSPNRISVFLSLCLSLSPSATTAAIKSYRLRLQHPTYLPSPPSLRRPDCPDDALTQYALCCRSNVLHLRQRQR